jgi:hypothetical protein
MSAYQQVKFMKTKHLFVIILLIAGCQKEIANLSSDVQGTWELVSAESAWGGQQEYEQGNGNVISFSGNTYSQKIKIRDTIYQYSGTFTIYKGKPCESAAEQTLIKFNDDEYTNRISLSDGKLTIGTTECIADGGSSTYRKIE